MGKKSFHLISAFLLLALSISAQQDILISQGGIVSVNNGDMFYDAGGPTGNDGNTSYTITLVPANPGESVCVDFTEFISTLGSLWGTPYGDFLEVYDGLDITATNLGEFAGNYADGYNGSGSPLSVGQDAAGCGGAGFAPGIFCANNPDGALTFRFRNEESGQQAGWVGEIITFVRQEEGCEIHISANDSSVCPGDEVTLFIEGHVVTPGVNTDFNNSMLGNGWFATPGGLAFVDELSCHPNNGYDTHNTDGSIYAWMQNVAAPRTLETEDFDVSNGGWLGFDFRMASDDNGSNSCEALDNEEGIYVQYSTDGGGTWTDIKLMHPSYESGGIMGCGEYVYDWGRNSLPIPAGAQTASTRFRWIQCSSSSSSTDSWGIDNITVNFNSSSTITITNETAGGTIVATTNSDTISLTETINANTTYRAYIEDDNDPTANCYQELTINVESCTQPECGTCTTPDCAITGPWADAQEAEDAQCNFSAFDYTQDMHELSPVATNTTYTSYHELTAGGDGNVGVVVSVGQSGTTMYPTACDAAEKHAYLYETDPCTTNELLPIDDNNVSPTDGYYNPEWENLIPNGTYILKIVYEIPENCELADHCVTFYASDPVCTCDNPCTMDEVRCFDERVYDGNDIQTIAPNATETFCYTINSGPNGFIGLVQQYGGTPGSDVRSAVLHPANDCNTDINPFPTNANGVGSGFNPEWSGLTPNTDYIACITIENTGFIDADVDPVSYYAPSCCDDEVGTQNPSITGNGTEDLTNNEFVLCFGSQFNLSTTGAVPSVDYAIYNCEPTSDDPSTDVCYTGYYFEQLNSMIEDCSGDASPVLDFLNGEGISFTNNTIWWVPITTDATGQYDAACYDMDYANKSYQVTYLNELTASGVEDCLNGTVTVTIEGGSPEYITGESYSIVNNGAGNLSTTTLNTSGGTIDITGLNDGENYDITITDGNGCSYNFTGGPFVDCNCPAQIGTYQVLVNGVDVTNANNEYILCYNDELDIVSNGDWTAPTPASSDPAGVGFGFYSEAPSNADPASDPNFSGQIQYTEDADDINSAGASSPIFTIVGTSNNYFYVVPFTLDDMVDGSNAAKGWDVNGDDCFEMGVAMKFTYLEEIIPDAGTDVEVCDGEQVTLTASATPNPAQMPNYSYTWNNGINQGTAFTPSVGTTTYTVTVSDANACVVTDDVEVTVNSLPNANAGNDIAVCAGESVTLTATGGIGYTWDNNVTQGQVFTPTTTDDYTVTVTNAQNCTQTDVVTVTVNPLPVADAGSDQNICFNSTATLTASGGDTYNWSTAQTNQSINVSPTATTEYQLTVSTNEGCEDYDTVMVNVTPEIVADITATMGTVCEGESTTLTASPAGMTYNWSTGESGSSITINPAATTSYSLTVSDNGCSDETTINIQVNDSISVVLNPDIICEGGSTSLTATAGDTYLWSTNETTQTITVSPNTTTDYYVTVTANGCSGNGGATVTVNPLPVANAGTDVTICNGEQTNLSASGGTSYAWNTGNNTQDITVSPTVTSTYLVTVTESGCSSTDEVLITVNPLPNVNAGNNHIICNGDTVILSATGGTSYVWNTGETLSDISVYPNTSTTYTVTATSLGCSASDQVTVTVNPIPDANAGTDVFICYGNSASLTANGGIDYYWSTGSTSQQISVSPLTDTYYYLTATENNCSGYDSVLVNVNDEIVPTVDATLSAICEDQQTQLTAGGGDSYAWNTGETTQVIDVSPTQTTTYTVTVISNQCSSEANIVVNVQPGITAVGSPAEICVGENTTLTVSAGDTYIWNTGDNTQNIAVSPTQTTEYFVTVTSQLCTDSTSIVVTVNPLPNAYAGEDVEICEGENTNLIAQGGTSYVWSNGMTSGGINVSPVQSTNYVVTVTENGCSNTDDVLVTVHELPIANAGADVTICEGEKIQLQATGGTQYSWSPDETLNSGSISDPMAWPTQTTTYTVVVSNGFCTDMDNVTVNIIPSVIADVSIQLYPSDTVCLGDGVDFTATGTNTGTNPTYSWYLNGNNVGANSNEYRNNYFQSSAYVSVEMESSMQCVINNPATDSVYIEVLPMPQVDFSVDKRTGCSPLTVHFNNQTNDPNGSYQWRFLKGDAFSEVSLATNPVKEFEIPGQYTVSLSYTNANGCSNSRSYQDLLEVYPLPEARGLADPEVADMYDAVIDFQNYSVDAIAYIWDFKDGDYSNLEEPTHRYLTTGNFEVELIAYTEYGCTDTALIPIRINPEVTFYAPNAFTPDGDGSNDLFCPVGRGIDTENFELYVYDRWGEIIYQSDQYQVSYSGHVQKGWDGTYKSQKAPMGTYAWLVVYKDVHGVEHQHAGNITLLR